MEAGNRYKTETVFCFRSLTTAAQDAVFSYVSDDLLKWDSFCSNKAATKDEYLTRPDYGRVFPRRSTKNY